MDYLKRFALWFSSGAGLALGLALAFFIALRIERNVESSKTEHPVDAMRAATDYVVTDVERIPITRVVTVSGSVQNNSDSKSDINLTLELVRNDKLIYRCHGFNHYLPNPHMAMRFQIECPEVDTEKVPGDIQYVVKAAIVTQEPR